MQHADARFERTQPREWERIPFALDYEPAPSAAEAIGWLLIGTSFAVICFVFLGL
ncbi:MAG TPA: hypothetical protein PLR85_18850 [Nitrospira sp.]|jgi:hypothetical protein|nr:hypothetical protein [Nitrospira sp.]HNA86886.1 hypothetical protein [Nitrospira sp.]HNG04466.1 hypothetical protein [Nitrospira sp.]HNG55451.1 hypothetical protein [Nitrospira sp.]